VADAKKAFGREMVQEKVLDEKGYELDPDSKLSVHSNKCRSSALHSEIKYTQALLFVPVKCGRFARGSASALALRWPGLTWQTT